jgi:hypothetical protein
MQRQESIEQGSIGVGKQSEPGIQWRTGSDAFAATASRQNFS